MYCIVFFCVYVCIGLTLEGGPIVIYEADTYLGEAMMETIKPGQKKFIEYCTENGMSV